MNGPYELTEAARELLAVTAERDELRAECARLEAERNTLAESLELVAARMAQLEQEREAEKKRALEWIEVQDERSFKAHNLPGGSDM